MGTVIWAKSSGPNRKFVAGYRGSAPNFCSGDPLRPTEDAMPRLTPTHNPQFTEEQLASAREVAARSSAPFREVIRARLTLLLAGDPSLSHRKLALRAGLSMQAVRK